MRAGCAAPQVLVWESQQQAKLLQQQAAMQLQDEVRCQMELEKLDDTVDAELENLEKPPRRRAALTRFILLIRRRGPSSA